MSKKHRRDAGDDTAGHDRHPHRHGTPGKGTLTQDLSSAASTDAPGASGDYSERDDDLKPKLAAIIDMSATAGGTRVIISQGKRQRVDEYSRVSLVAAASGRHLNDARKDQVNEEMSSMITPASMDVIDTNDGKIKLEE